MSGDVFNKEITVEEIYLMKEFSSKDYLPINKKLIKIFGIEPSVWISNLIEKFLYFESNKETNKSGTFYYKHEHQIKDLNLNEQRIRKYKKLFIDLGILKTEMKGLPQKEWYKININKLISIIDEVNFPGDIKNG